MWVADLWRRKPEQVVAMRSEPMKWTLVRANLERTLILDTMTPTEASDFLARLEAKKAARLADQRNCSKGNT
jgi:hypothetical protein